MNLLKKQKIFFVLISIFIFSFLIFNLTVAESGIGITLTNSRNTDISNDKLKEESDLVGKTQKNTSMLSTYSHSELNYSFNYPGDWSFVTYPSNGYLAVGLYDPKAQTQDSQITHLIQGAKIEISTIDYIPPNGLTKDYIKYRSPLGLGEIISIENIQSNADIEGIFTRSIFDSNLSLRTTFIKDEKMYVASLSIINFGKISSETAQEYEDTFFSLLKSFKF